MILTRTYSGILTPGHAVRVTHGIDPIAPGDLRYTATAWTDEAGDLLDCEVLFLGTRKGRAVTDKMRKRIAHVARNHAFFEAAIAQRHVDRILAE